MRRFSPVEAAFGVALAGTVLATFVPAFVENLQASRLVEPIDGLNKLAGRATALAGARPVEQAYPASAPMTPKTVPAGGRASDPDDAWKHPTWQQLDFRFTVPHSYAFQFESSNAVGRSTFKATARGDLDGDGVLSQFVISGESKDGDRPRVFPMDIYREVE